MYGFRVSSIVEGENAKWATVIGTSGFAWMNGWIDRCYTFEHSCVLCSTKVDVIVQPRALTGPAMPSWNTPIFYTKKYE